MTIASFEWILSNFINSPVYHLRISTHVFPPRNFQLTLAFRSILSDCGGAGKVNHILKSLRMPSEKLFSKELCKTYEKSLKLIKFWVQQINLFNTLGCSYWKHLLWVLLQLRIKYTLKLNLQIYVFFFIRILMILKAKVPTVDCNFICIPTWSRIFSRVFHQSNQIAISRSCDVTLWFTHIPLAIGDTWPVKIIESPLHMRQ